MKRWYSLLALPVLAACSGGSSFSDPTQPFFTARSGEITQTVATDMKSEIQTAFKFGFEKPGSLPGSGVRRLVRGEDSPFFPCTTITPDPVVDADGDFIPLLKSLTFACENIAVGRTETYTANLKGTETQKDLDDTSANGGYRFDFNYEGGYTSSEGRTESYGNFGYFEFTGSDGAWSYKTNYAGTGKNGDANGSVSYVGGHTFNHTWTPTDTNNPEAGATLTLSGFFASKIEIEGTPAGGQTAKDFVAEIASTGLLYEAAASCTEYWKEGEVTLTEGTNTIKWVFDCNTVAVTFNGVAI